MQTLKIILTYSLLLFAISSNALSQEYEDITHPPSPSEITPDQVTLHTITHDRKTEEKLKAAKAIMSATGSTITQQQIEDAIKNDPRLKHLDSEAIGALKQQYSYGIALPDVETLTNTGHAPAPAAAQTPPMKEHPPARENIPIATEESAHVEETTELTIFGMNFFLPARNRILALEKILKTGSLPQSSEPNALSGFVGPLDMVSSNVNATIPDKYILGAGDNVIIYFWADSIALTSYKLNVNNQGDISVPQLGKLTVRGMTITQLQDALTKQMERVLGKKEINLIATLETLKSMQITITGEAFRPGSYAVSAVTTLFNALQACGGPSDQGSLRDIKLIRGPSVIPIDFYDFLLTGNSAKDYPLFQGDMIYISKREKLVTIKGEVNRPAIYELKKNEKLNTIIKFANGNMPTAFTEKIQVESVNPNKERIILDVNLKNPATARKIGLCDGDIVTVPRILPKILNIVTVKGAVERPGVYELKPNMRIADLFTGSNQPLGEAFLERADLIRLNQDESTTTLIPINLKQALWKSQAHNITLAPRDTLRIYSKWEFAFYPERQVSVIGSVQRPGKYERSDNMTISDLIIKSGGLLPDTSKDKAILLRYDLSTNQYAYITLDLNDTTVNDKPLTDMDELYIFSSKDVKYTPIHEVAIYGAVQRPGTYNRTKDMKLSDLLYLSGGVVPGFHTEVEIAKARNDNIVKTLTLDISETGDVIDDPMLEDGDIVMIRKKSEYFEKPIWVEISGEVKYPGRYPLRGKNERLSSLIERAGGLTHYAYSKGTVFLRDKKNINSDIQRGLLTSVNTVTNLLNELDYERQKVRNQWMLLEAKADGKSLDPFQLKTAAISSGDDPAEAAAIAMSPQVASQTGQAVQKFVSATEDGPGVAARARVFNDNELEPPEKQRLILSLQAALEDQNGPNDPILMNGDDINIPRKQETISVVGALMHPTLIKYTPTKKGGKYKYYINRAGGFAQDANRKNVLVARVDGSIMHVNDIKKIEPGDIIYVPPRVISMEIVSKTDRIIDAIKFSLVVGASVAAFITLVGMF